MSGQAPTSGSGQAMTSGSGDISGSGQAMTSGSGAISGSGQAMTSGSGFGSGQAMTSGSVFHFRFRSSLDFRFRKYFRVTTGQVQSATNREDCVVEPRHTPRHV